MSRHCRRLWAGRAVLVGVLLLLLWVLSFAGSPGLSSFAPLVQAHAGVKERPHYPEHPIHALPTHEDPAPNAVLKVPPTEVQITFDEQLNPDVSTIVVVNPSNQEVDNKDRRISADQCTMTVTLPLLPAGTYVVFWRTHSIQDGHIAGGSYIFHIARADGSVPPLTGKLPTGTIIGGAGLAEGNDVTGPAVLDAVARWLALLALTLLLGILFWWVVVQPRQRLAETLAVTLERSLRQAAGLALLFLMIVTLLEVAAQSLTLGGGLSALVSPPLLGSILWNSKFGHAILVRIVLILAGALVLWRRQEALLLGPQNPRNQRLLLLAYGAVLALAVEFSGHGGSAPTWWGQLVDYLHLLANGIWLGGLLCLAVAVIPALRTRSRQEREGYLTADISAFSIPALLAVAFVIVTGPLNATVRMTSLQQLWTTTYGILLLIKTALFLGMAAISYYHAFILRPRLAALGRATGVPSGAPGSGPLEAADRVARLPVIGRVIAEIRADLWREASSAAVLPTLSAGDLAVSPTGSSRAERVLGPGESSPEKQTPGARGEPAEKESRVLARRIMSWLTIEAAVGAAVLLCAALLGLFAGTLAPSPTTVSSFGASGGAQTITHTVDGLAVTLSVSPGKFGTNTFTVLVKNADGTPVSNGSLFIETNMVEMDMGAATINLKPAETAGTYSGQGQLTMAGHWRVKVVIRTQADPTHLHTATFTVSASF